MTPPPDDLDDCMVGFFMIFVGAFVLTRLALAAWTLSRS